MQIRMGQINQGGFSWNAAPGGFNPYLTPYSNPYAGAPSFQQSQAEPIAQDCYTCTNPDTGDTQYGVQGNMASQLKSKGYRCRKDECARGGSQAMIPPQASLINPMATQGYAQVSQDFGGMSPGGYSFMSGRIPLAPGLGRRALS